MKKLLLTLLLFVPLLITAQKGGRKFYVALDGNDSNPGTIAQPFATWQRGFTATNLPGDTLFIRGGRYMSQLPVSYDPENFPAPTGGIGTYESPIVIMGYPGEWPILDCTFHCDNIPERPYGKRYNSAIGVRNTEYIHFKDLEVCNVFQCDSVVDGAIGAAYSCNLSFEHIIIHDVGQRGFFVQGGVWGPWDGRDPTVAIEPSKWGFGHPDTTRFVNCDVYNLADTLSSEPGNAADAWKTIHYETSYITWTNCRAWSYTDDGIDPNCVGGTRIIENCWAMPGDKYKQSISSHWEVERNGFKVTGPTAGYNPDKNHLIFKNNVSYDCTHGLILMDSYGTDRNNALVYNNTILKCQLGIANWEDSEGMRPNTNIFKNTLVHNTYGRNAIDQPYDTYILSDVPYDVSHCSWQWSATEFQNREYNPAFKVTDADFISMDHATIFEQLTAPRKSDGSLPDITALQLAPGSDLINAGIDVGIPFIGSAPDIGAFEFNPKGEGLLKILNHSLNNSTKQVDIRYFSPANKSIDITVLNQLDTEVIKTNHNALIGERNKVNIDFMGFELGTYTISLSDKYSTTSCKVTIGDEEDSIGAEEYAKQVRIYPNPASSRVDVITPDSGEKRIRILDLTGRAYNFYTFSGKENHINVNNLPSGLYFVQITSRNITIAKKLVVRNL